MANFDWRGVDERDPRQRFGTDLAGVDLWLSLLQSILQLQERWFSDERYEDELRDSVGEGPEPPPGDAGVREEIGYYFTTFLEAAGQLHPRPRLCRVFVSHQRKDVAFGERIAWLATRHGFEYWFDIHDPALRFINAARMPAFVRAASRPRCATPRP